MTKAPRFKNPVLTSSYRSAVAWIAANDEPGDMDGDETERLVSVAMIADLHFTTTARVARDVLRIRRTEARAEDERRTAEAFDRSAAATTGVMARANDAARRYTAYRPDGTPVSVSVPVDR